MNIIHDVEYFQKKVIFKFGNELKKYEPDFDLPYILFGAFALFVNDLIKKESASELLKEVGLVIEEMAESKDPDVKDLFMVGFLEVFADEVNSVEYSRIHFSKQVNGFLDVILEFWRRNKNGSR